MSALKKEKAKRTGQVWLLRLLKSALLFICGIVFTLFLQSWFIARLPGPKPTATIHSTRVTSGNANGCTFYVLSLLTDEPLDFIYLKLQFRQEITNYQVGFPWEGESESGRKRIQIWQGGRNANGQCAVLSAQVDIGDVQVSSGSSMIGIHTSKLDPKSLLLGIFSSATGESQPSALRYFEGAFEYSKLGQTVRKPVTITDLGVSEAK